MILEALSEFIATVPRPTEREWEVMRKEKGWPALPTVVSRFGGRWSAAVKAAGGDPLPSGGKTLTEEDFWSRADCSGDCWIWRGVIKNNGYGSLTYTGKSVSAHRLAWFFSRGEWPDEGTHVHHRCGTRSCVNPQHLMLVQPQQHARIERALRTHCRRGHPLPLFGQCMQCRRESSKRGDLARRQRRTEKRLIARLEFALDFLGRERVEAAFRTAMDRSDGQEVDSGGAAA